MRRAKNLVARKPDKTDDEHASHHLICLHITPRGPDHEAKSIISGDDFRDDQVGPAPGVQPRFQPLAQCDAAMHRERQTTVPEVV